VVKRVAKTHSFSVWKRKISSKGKPFYLEYVSLNEASESVMIIPFTSKMEILFIKKYFPAEDTIELVLPGGKIKKGQSKKQTANRELIEEIGFGAKKLKHLTTLNILPAYFVGKTYAFLAEDLYKSSKFKPDEREELSVVKMPLKKAISYIKKGKIKDARTTATILYLTTFFPRRLN